MADIFEILVTMPFNVTRNEGALQRARSFVEPLGAMGIRLEASQEAAGIGLHFDPSPYHTLLSAVVPAMASYIHGIAEEPPRIADYLPQQAA